MNLLGLNITRRQKAVPQTLSSVDGRGGWWPIIREAASGFWQRNLEVSHDEVVAFSTVYACVSLISSDIAKLWLGLVKVDADGVWTETENSAYSPVLRKPNHYQDRIKFFEQWILSKLLRGNTYVLKVRDNRDVVIRLYILDAKRVQPMVAPDGAVFYKLQRDDLSGLKDDVMVPASEVIHDIMCALYHPLVGVSPIFACGLAAMQGLRIQQHSAKFFANHAQPSGILTAPGIIEDESAKKLQERWHAQFSGDNAGKVAVLGNGLAYQPMTVNAVDAQLIEQLKWTSETVCSCFHVPPYMVGVGPAPTYNNIEALNQQYYAQCLQNLIESLELCLDEGLELKKPYGVEFDLDALLRMDTATRVKAAADAVGSGVVSPDEARKKYFGFGTVEGGDTPYLQQQNYSLKALAKRDASADPFGTATSAPKAEPKLDAIESSDAEKRFTDLLRKEMALIAA